MQQLHSCLSDNETIDYNLEDIVGILKKLTEDQNAVVKHMFFASEQEPDEDDEDIELF